MPSYHCRQPGCATLLTEAGFCTAHQPQAKVESARRHQWYDQHARNPEAKRFYDSAAWQRARADKLATNPTCERCKNVFAEHVHHVVALAHCTEAQKTDPLNLMCLCAPCHNITEAEYQPPDAEQPLVTALVVTEDEIYRFDAEKAAKPVRFIEKYCRHFEGRFAGQPFILLPWQRRLVETLFGWVHRETGLRRFRELYLLSAKGSGKTPLLTAIGLYMLLGDSEAAPHVISMASTFEQANLTFSAAKGYIAECPALQPHVDVVQYQIKTKKHGRWNTISGKPSGRSGPRPSCIIADEVHEWPGATAQAFELLTANLFKRAQPLLMVATNAAASKSSFAWTLHERACKILKSEIVDPSLLPVIFEADKSLKWDSEEAAKAANPSLGDIVQWSQLVPALAKANESPSAEAHYRRLYLSQWVHGGHKWLNMSRWDTCTSEFDRSTLTTQNLYVGLDLSAGDDLCAATFLWWTPERLHVDCRFWLPRETADKYQKQDGHTYREWEAAGHITLLDETTITPAVQVRIATDIMDTCKGHTVKAIAYDRYKADAIVAALEAKAVTCIPVAQGFTLSSGCTELERRLKDESITIQANQVLRFCAENAETTTDSRGNSWVVKPNARGRYAGRRSMKVDGVVALVTGLTEALRQEIKPVTQNWDGSITFV